MLTTMGLFYLPFFMDLVHAHDTLYAQRCMGDYPELITNSVLYKSDWYISCNLCHIQ